MKPRARAADGVHGAAAVPQPRRRLLETSGGSRVEAFGWSEWGLLASIALIWGSSFFFIAVGLESLRPGVISLARVALGAGALALIPRARRPVDREDLPRVLLLGVVWMGIPLILFPLAQQWIDSSVAGMINGAVPIATVVWSVALLGRFPAARQRWGLLLGFAGMAAISWPSVQGSTSTALGVVLVLLAVILYGLAANLAVPLQQRYGALPVLLRAQLVALVVIAPFGLTQLDGSSWAWWPVLAMVPLGVLGTGFAFVMMTTLVGRVGGPRGSVTIYFTPIVAILLGTVLLGEPFHVLAGAGTAMVLAGAWLASRSEAPVPTGRTPDPGS